MTALPPPAACPLCPRTGLCEADPSPLPTRAELPGGHWSFASIDFAGTWWIIFVPSYVIWLTSGYFLPILGRVARLWRGLFLIGYMSHNPALCRNSKPTSLEFCVNNRSITKKLPSCGRICPGLSPAYFKSIICTLLHGDDNIGLCNFVPLLLSRSMCISNAECEISIGLKKFAEQTRLGESLLLFPSNPSLFASSIFLFSM